MTKTRDLRRDGLPVSSSYASEGCYPHITGSVRILRGPTCTVRKKPNINYSLVGLVEQFASTERSGIGFSGQRDPVRHRPPVRARLFQHTGAGEGLRLQRMASVPGARAPEHIKEELCFVPDLEPWLELQVRARAPTRARRGAGTPRDVGVLPSSTTTTPPCGQTGPRPWRSSCIDLRARLRRVDVLRQPPESLWLHDLTDAMRLLLPFGWLC